MAASLMQPELDPLFAKALRLLQSKEPQSIQQLNNLVQEQRDKILGIVSKKVSEVSGRISPKIEIKSNNGRNISSSFGADSKRPVVTSLIDSLKEVTYESEKKSLKPVVSTVTTTETTESIVEEISLGSSHSLKRLKKSHENNLLDISSPESDANDSIPIDQIIEMDFGGPTCASCHLGKSMGDDNVLVECSECSASYHQKCHKPNVTTKEINDPRLIWYCSKCMKKMKREMAEQQQISSSIAKTVESSAPPPKPIVSNPFQQSKPFRRPSAIPTADTSKTSTSTSSSSGISTTSVTNINSGDPTMSLGTATLEEPQPPASASTREGSPVSTKYNRNREMAKQAMNRLEQVRKRAKLQALNKARK